MIGLQMAVINGQGVPAYEYPDLKATVAGVVKTDGFTAYNRILGDTNRLGSSIGVTYIRVGFLYVPVGRNLFHYVLGGFLQEYEIGILVHYVFEDRIVEGAVLVVIYPEPLGIIGHYGYIGFLKLVGLGEMYGAIVECWHQADKDGDERYNGSLFPKEQP